MRGPAPSRGSTEFPRVVQTGERRRSYLTAFPNCAKAQTDNPTALELEGDVPQKREGSCQSSLWEDEDIPILAHSPKGDKADLRHSVVDETQIRHTPQ